MILNRLFCEYGYVNTSQAGYINDLRAVIAKFMGRDEPDWYVTSRCLDNIPKNGQWHFLDGGALRIRLYKKGTGHIEIHPDMSWRLNCVLANLYPNAIPAEFRVRERKAVKDFVLLQKPLPFEVIRALSAMSIGKGGMSRILRHDKSTDVQNRVVEVLKALGGVDNGRFEFEFDYDPADAISYVIVTGCLPDHKSYQYYPTPDSLAEVALGFADIGDTDECLEPSAGQGGLAFLLPKGRTDCVEISALHCKILETKGFSVDQCDFLKWAGKGKRYDRVILNPPFSENRWKAHLEHAGTFVKPRGRLVAILPSSAKSYLLDGFECRYHGPYENEFAGTGISVIILVGDKAA